MNSVLEQRFAQHRDQVRLIAYRMLGSAFEAEDAVQETWLRLAAADGIDNLPAWLTTVVSRICLDMLRARQSRREDLIGHDHPGDRPAPEGTPEEEAVLVEQVGRAMLVVLDRLGPDERVAFVLHDMFAVPFERIAPMVGRTTDTTKKLASRARRKVQGDNVIPAEEVARQRRVATAFLAAARAGDLAALLEVLSPDVVRHADRHAIGPDRPTEARGARTVAGEVSAFGRNSRFATLLLVDGAVGMAVAPHGRVKSILTFEFADDRITEYRLIADPERLARLELAVLP
ncbi:sigma-70 family RNA polymerase sigma factor [Nocardia panacis]|uniref:Sigma-70 family RNA polymerase sigma factor n=1 Tax=Nocardia panacis TaxID=2340916 RepID=A0A3A4KGJ1_9NOCA|nr:sigma-70 family RNA polymerase sigma factor [Nocardia panacis]RJO73378.1 sigma-70 family RNA polymerase sigma factor [Nocardia panacis]